MLKPREFLSLISGTITSQYASILLNASPQKTALILSRWTQQGWLQRVGRGLYAAKPVSGSEESVLDHSFGLVPSLIGQNGYVCGWSACEYWGLTDQIFLDLSLASYIEKRKKEKTLKDRKVIIFPVHRSQEVGLKTIWQDNKKIFISDLDKTILDILCQPHWALGFMHLVDCFKEYLKADNHNIDQLLNYAKKVQAPGVFYKRLGFLLEKESVYNERTQYCHERITLGYSTLDPQTKKGKIHTRWNLIIPNYMES